jgi:hypothetical protein
MSKRILYFTAGITAFRIIYAFLLPVTPQEAYYWNYSRHPALSYFDHPPLAAYWIKLTTIFGVSNFSIHLAAVILSALMTLAVYRLGYLLFGEKTGFWSAVTINLAFIYALGGLIITPDGPMILFWILTMIACHRIGSGRDGIWWILLGLFLGAGFVSKYTMIFSWLGVALFFLSSKERMRLFKTVRPYSALLVMAVVMLPVIYWNYQNNWASFLFQTGRRAGEMTEFRPDFFLGYIGTIIGIYGIIPIPLLLTGMWNSVKLSFKRKLPEHTLLVSFSVPLVIFLLPVATRYWVKMNWTAPAFLGWFIAATAYYFNSDPRRRWLRFWGKFSVIFLALAFLLVHIAAIVPGLYIGRGDYFAGWKELAARVDEIRNEMPGPYFICGYEYKTASLLAFYLDGRPETVSNNIVGLSGLQYDFWTDPDTLAGYSAIFVYDERVPYKTPENLKRYFGSVSESEIMPVKKGGKTITNFHIFLCYDYGGPGKGEPQ